MTMLSLQEQLNQIPWEALKHAYGPATDTPMHLLALLSENEEEREKALTRLWASICHQGSVYEASAVAAPFLIQILEQVPDEQKPPLLDLLDGLAVRHWYAGRDLMKLTMVDTKHQRWRSSEQFLREGNHYHKPEWMASSHASVSEGIPVFLALLQSTNQETVCKALALGCLGDLLAEQAPEWEEYERLIALPSNQVHSSVRLAAAATFAKYHPGKATPELINILVENMLQPGLLDLQVLSQLGMPRGWQALISLLERGAPNWILLDTIRVAEAVLDMAFFGGWVENRYWNYRSKTHSLAVLKAFEISEGEMPDSTEIEDIPDLSEGVATFSFHYGITSSYPLQPDDLLVDVWGYDRVKAQNLSQRYKQQGAQALSKEQVEALRVVLRCQPLWQYRHNLMDIYGLPITQHELVAFLLGKR